MVFSNTYQYFCSDLRQVGNEPCGYCGRSGTCSIGLIKPARALVPVSDCPYFQKFSLVAAGKSTTSGPSTNRPLRCDICHERQVANRHKYSDEHVFWSYNMEAHIEKKHPGVIISDTFQTSYLVTAEEMKNLQIEVKPAPKSGGTKWKLSKSGNVDFGGNHGPKQHHR